MPFPQAFSPSTQLSAKERGQYNLGVKLTLAFEVLAKTPSPFRSRLVDAYHEEKGRTASDEEIARWEENREEEDEEEWMRLSGEDIQRILQRDGMQEQGLKEMISSLEQMMKGESGFEGIDDDDSYVLSYARC